MQSQLEDNFTKLTIHEEKENHVEERELQFEVTRLDSSNLNRYLKAVRNVSYKLSKWSAETEKEGRGGCLPVNIRPNLWV